MLAVRPKGCAAPGLIHRLVQTGNGVHRLRERRDCSGNVVSAVEVTLRPSAGI